MNKKNSKLVSIIIPTYKRTDMLARAIRSVLNQTYKNIEIIVVDDNESNSIFRKEVEIIMQSFQGDSRVKYIQHPYNKNGAAARNTGIKSSTGDYISFLDDDDYYLPEKIKKEVQFLEENNFYDAVYCGRYEKGRKILPKLAGDLSKEILLLSFTPTTSTLMFRSQIVKEMNGFNESFKRHQDFEFLLRYFENHKIGFVNEPLVFIGQNNGENELHGELLESNKKAFLEQFGEKIIKFDNEVKGFKKRIFVAHYSPVFWDHISQGYFLLAIRTYLLGTKTSPISFNIALLFHFFKYLFYIIHRKRRGK